MSRVDRVCVLLETGDKWDITVCSRRCFMNSLYFRFDANPDVQFNAAFAFRQIVGRLGSDFRNRTASSAELK